MSSTSDPGAIVVGIAPGISPRVLHEAAQFARDTDVELVCAHVEAARYPVEFTADGSVMSMPLDPDVPDLREEAVDAELENSVRETLAEVPVPLRFCALAGDPAQALAELAERIRARAIVVGTRHPGFRSGVEEFFTGSIAVRLAHRQNRPVIVVPVQPQLSAAPWEFGE